MKKILLSLVAIMLATVARAADGDTFTFEGLKYKVLSEADHTAEVALNDVSGEVNIPTYVTANGSRYTVTSIGKSAFKECSDLTSVTIPNSVTEIGMYAFEYCSSLTSVTIPNSVTEIGWYAFYHCSSLTSVTIPNSVTTIGWRAFSGCSSLTSVTIPNSVTSLDDGPFADCTKLEEIIVEDGNENYCSDNGALYNLDKTGLIQCPGAKTEFDIPSSVHFIREDAFRGCSSLPSVTIPNSVTDINSYAFDGCSSLTSVTIPSSVKYIGSGPFADCTKLEEIIVEDGNENYCSDNGALYNLDKTRLFQCPGAKTELDIPNSVINVEQYAFDGCSSLTSVTISNSMWTIHNSLFAGCSSLTSVTIPNSVTSIQDEAFRGCSSLTSVTIPNSVTFIHAKVFYDCSSLTKIIDLNPFPQATDTDAFKNVPSDAVVYIPKGSYMYYGQSGFLEYFSDFREMGAFDITLSESTLRLSEGESAKLTVTVVKDDDVTIGDHEWTSSNPEVATVEDGKVIAIAPGTAEITYTVYDGYGVAHSDSCKVVVGAAGINDVTVDDTSSSVYVYTLSGMTVLSNAPVDEVHNLPAGLYIVRQGNTVKKIAVK